jgi:hypothetical protein
LIVMASPDDKCDIIYSMDFLLVSIHQNVLPLGIKEKTNY